MFGNSAKANIQIQSYRTKYSWKDEWSTSISEELKKPEYREGKTAFLNISIDEDDLDDLECGEYNNASFEQKTDFWIVFFSALARAESGFNEKARSALSRGHRSFGLLQLSKSTAKSQCGINPPESSVINPKDNLICGIKLMVWQLNGGPTSSGKKLRSDLEGQIFGKYIFQWGPLRQNDRRGRKLLMDWFKIHLTQLKFCLQK